MDFNGILALLTDIGIPEEVLGDADGSWHLRRDLALSSAETVALQAQLQPLVGGPVSLWGGQDFTLDDLVALVNGTQKAGTS